MAFTTEVAGLFAVSLVTGASWHFAFYGDHGPIEAHAAIGLLTALTYGLSFLIRDEYAIGDILKRRRTKMRIFLAWNAAFLALAVIGFLTKTTGFFSRASLLAFYVFGFGAAMALDGLIVRAARGLVDQGFVSRRRLMLVGTLDDVRHLKNEIDEGAAGVCIAAAGILPDVTNSTEEAIAANLDAAVASARKLSVDDIIISSAWSNSRLIEQAISAFMVLPVSIHLGASGVIGRFAEAKVSRFGSAATLALVPEPLGPFEVLAKRCFDFVIALIALVLLSPLFALIAILIKMDSEGPVFFRQRRYGFNLVEFRIWKFRTMTADEDGDVVQQARRSDPRVTRLGALLRRTSLDELPQLINVLAGHMSLVGPRPHAVAHDKFYEKRIAMYPRRMNVKPGITGWAQVNGHRGPTETDEAMHSRVMHDIYYIENWSVLLDVKIMILTIFSPRTLKNAF